MGARASFRIAKGLRLSVSSRGVRASMRAGPFSYSAPLAAAPRAARSYGPTAAQLAREEKERQRHERLFDLGSISFGLEQDGSLWIRDRNGEQVTSKSELDLIWREYASDLKSFLSNQLLTFGADAQLLARIHCDTPNPAQSRPFVPASFDEPRPEAPGALALPEKPTAPEVQKSLIGAFTGANRKARAQSEAEYAQALVTWERECDAAKQEHTNAEASWRQQQADWMQRKSEHDANQREAAAAHANLLKTNVEYARSVVRDALEAQSWPREMSVAVSTDDANQSVKLDIDLPEIEDFPRQTASMHASGRKLVFKTKTDKQLRQEYAAHIHGILLRLAGIVFWTLPDARRVTASGYSQLQNPATGYTEDEYLLSAIIERDAFMQLNFSALDAINPIEALAQFDLRRSMTSSFVFSKIEPR